MKFCKLSYFLILFLFLSGCGFKPIKFSELSNFQIAEIETFGDKRINYIIRNNLSIYSKDNQENLISIKIETSKKKAVKEKNINNEITKYEIDINSEISFKLIKNNKSANFIINKSGVYNLTNQYSQSLNNEKKLIERLSEKIAQEAINKIINKINAF